MFLRYSDLVSNGDEVLVMDNDNQLVPAIVIDVSKYKMQGKCIFTV